MKKKRKTWLPNGAWPRHHANLAFRIWEREGKDAAVKFIASIRPPGWRRLIYNHAKIAIQKAHPQWQNTGGRRRSTQTSGK